MRTIIELFKKLLRCFGLKRAIKDELKKYKIFKEKYEFHQKVIAEKDGCSYCEGDLVIDAKGNVINSSDNWINVGYKFKESYSKILSNLFPYEFTFKGKRLHCIETFFQGVKFKDPMMQDLVLCYSGIDAYNIKAASNYDWRESGIIYWQGKPINRFSEEYTNLVDELYISAIQNPIFRSALMYCNRHIIHSIGVTDKKETLLTRYEYESILNCLKDFLKLSKDSA